MNITMEDFFWILLIALMFIVPLVIIFFLIKYSIKSGTMKKDWWKLNNKYKVLVFIFFLFSKGADYFRKGFYSSEFLISKIGFPLITLIMIYFMAVFAGEVINYYYGKEGSKKKSKKYSWEKRMRKKKTTALKLKITAIAIVAGPVGMLTHWNIPMVALTGVVVLALLSIAENVVGEDIKTWWDKRL